jgi:xanthine dehydrogenase accessory factor
MPVVTSIFARMAELAAAGTAFAVATVVRTVGSTPQVVGAKLLVTATDKTRADGTLGGGCVEADAILAAREVLAQGGRSLRAYQLTEDLAWNTGLVCGGTMWILAERGADALAAGPDLVDRLARAALGGDPIAIATRLRRQARGLVYDGRVYVDAGGARWGSLGEPALDDRARDLARDQLRHGTARVVAIDDEHELLIEPVASRPRLVVAGGGHVAAAIARQAQLLDFAVTILEDRPEFATPDRFGGASVLTGDVPTTIGTLDYGWNSFLVIATRGHKLDADCVLAAVATGVGYIGLLGSRRKTLLIAERLRAEGVADDRIQTIHAPVGLDLGGRTPAEIALSVLAEITAERYQATARPLRRVRATARPAHRR